MDSNPKVTSTVIELHILFGVITRTIAQSIHSFLGEKAVDISGLQYGILRILNMEKMTLSDLSRRMLLDPSTLVPSVEGLVKRGLVVRQQDPEDRRRQPLQLTQEGKDLLEQVPLHMYDDFVTKAVKQLGEEKTQVLLEVLREIIQTTPNGAAVLDNIQEHLNLHCQNRPTHPES